MLSSRTSRRYLDRPSRLLDEASDLVTERPWSITGLLLVILAVAVGAWVLPEIRRYLRLERM